MSARSRRCVVRSPRCTPASVSPQLHPARSPWEGPSAPAEAAAVPIPNSPGGPQSSRRKSAGGGGCGDDRASLCQRCRPSDGIGSGRHVYPSRPVVRPDSSTSSIRRSCRNRNRDSDGLGWTRRTRESERPIMDGGSQSKSARSVSVHWCSGSAQRTARQVHRVHEASSGGRVQAAQLPCCI